MLLTMMWYTRPSYLYEGESHGTRIIMPRCTACASGSVCVVGGVETKKLWGTALSVQRRGWPPLLNIAYKNWQINGCKNNSNYSTGKLLLYLYNTDHKQKRKSKQSPALRAEKDGLKSLLRCSLFICCIQKHLAHWIGYSFGAILTISYLHLRLT